MTKIRLSFLLTFFSMNCMEEKVENKKTFLKIGKHKSVSSLSIEYGSPNGVITQKMSAGFASLLIDTTRLNEHHSAIIRLEGNKNYFLFFPKKHTFLGVKPIAAGWGIYQITQKKWDKYPLHTLQ